MYKLTLRNEANDELVFNELGSVFTIEKIEGLSPADATINTAKIALLDGQKFYSSKVNMRTINIAFAIEKDAAINRINVYRVLKPKQPITVYYVSEVRDVFINGYVQSVNVDHFAKKQVCTVAIICPYPFWLAAQQIVNELSQVVNMFHFAFASTEAPQLVFGNIDVYNSLFVENGGDLETGLIFELYASASVVNPKIYDYITQDFIGLNFTFQAADLVTIDTTVGNKSIMLLRDGNVTNIFNTLMRGSTWLQLPANGGTYTYEVESGSAANLNVAIKHNNIYEGV